MHTASLVLSVLLALGMLVSGVQKLRRAPRIRAFAEVLDLTPAQLTTLAILQIAATVGLVSGIWFAPFAIAAAIGSVLYFVGAIIVHVRAGDRAIQAAAGFLFLSGATLVLLIATAAH